MFPYQYTFASVYLDGKKLNIKMKVHTLDSPVVQSFSSSYLLSINKKVIAISQKTDDL